MTEIIALMIGAATLGVLIYMMKKDATGWLAK
jgi:hypothetical protein